LVLISSILLLAVIVFSDFLKFCELFYVASLLLCESLTSVLSDGFRNI
jgi:hypothetical protein